MERIGVKYINLLTELYRIPEQVENKMRENELRIDDAFKGYCWADVERIVSVYYAYKSDKTYPKISQIMALLRADKDVKRVDMENEQIVPITEPKTNIVVLGKVFSDACLWLHKNGVLYFEYFDKIKKIPYGNKMRVIVTQDKFGVNQNTLWNVRYDCDDAISAAREKYPDVYAQFEQKGPMSFCEQFAFAVQLGVMRI